MEIHLDLMGGLAGDMFIAALLDAWPEHEARVRQAIGITRGSHAVSCSLVPHLDQVLAGSRFMVSAAAVDESPTVLNGASRHTHMAWREIRGRLSNSSLPQGVCRHALGIFQLLACAEGQVHGVTTDSVQFHEVGAWDSIADIVGAAVLIDALGVTRWSFSAIPLGSGRVDTAHGPLPVPAPATALLLLGMSTVDDGVSGERVTPTGAAILRYLSPPTPKPMVRRSCPRTLIASGTGFGSRTLPGLSNHVRALCFDGSGRADVEHRCLQSIEFEVDDQSGEDLAMALDRLRAHPGALDVSQTPVFGKKGRVTVHVRVLTRAEQLDEVVKACFEETTTIGLRHHSVQGIGLKRRMAQARIDGHTLRVKVVDRPGQATAKAESDDVLIHANHQQRASLRRRAEAAVLADLPDGIDA